MVGNRFRKPGWLTGQGFDSFTLLQVRVAAAEMVDRAGL